jgi:hypothetical protein
MLSSKLDTEDKLYISLIIAVNALIWCNFEKNDAELNEVAEFKGLGCWVKSWKLGKKSHKNLLSD